VTAEAQASSWLSPDDIYLFNEGSHSRLWQKLGAHPGVVNRKEGVHFTVWAPNAERVSVIGDFNAWNKSKHVLKPIEHSGLWTCFIPGIRIGARYKYHVAARHSGYHADKTDPFAFYREVPPNTASYVWDLEYDWNDQRWMEERARRNALTAPTSVYEVHLGSWRRGVERTEQGMLDRFLTYREMADQLPDYVAQMGFTHVEFLPVMEHPFYGSWGYQTTGYFAPTSRFGTPQDFMYLVDRLHQRGVGVILDWVPSHFPTDEHGLGYFDGTHLYEHADPRQGFHPDWNSYIFNYGRNEVRSFLLSSALYWLEVFHADALRVDAVASMLYLDYSRRHGEWIPNEFGGRENLYAISFLRRFNEEMFRAHPDSQTIAEESTAWPMVSRPTYVGGLGFGMKWDMGWMHDTLDYMSHDPVHRTYHHNRLTFRLMYAFSENFMLPLSHDEVVHGKGSLLGKMPGDLWRKFANLRTLYGYMYAQPGKKLVFMGGELAQVREWNHDSSLDWHLLEDPLHAGVQRWLRDLNVCYRDHTALHEKDFQGDGFQWVDANDSVHSVISLLRFSSDGEVVLVVCNFTPVPRLGYRIGVPYSGTWTELLNSDAELYGGSGMGNLGAVEAEAVEMHGRPCSVSLTLPPLSAVFLVQKRQLETTP
jgi:1,4-alpha-glucan branching enzyme